MEINLLVPASVAGMVIGIIEVLKLTILKDLKKVSSFYPIIVLGLAFILSMTFSLAALIIYDDLELPTALVNGLIAGSIAIGSFQTISKTIKTIKNGV